MTDNSSDDGKSMTRLMVETFVDVHTKLYLSKAIKNVKPVLALFSISKGFKFVDLPVYKGTIEDVDNLLRKFFKELPDIKLCATIIENFKKQGLRIDGQARNGENCVATLNLTRDAEGYVTKVEAEYLTGESSGMLTDLFGIKMKGSSLNGNKGHTA